MKNKCEWDKTLGELDRVRRDVSAFLLLRNNKGAGLITARWVKGEGTSFPSVHIALIIYASMEYGLPIFEHTVVKGCGFPMLNTGIACILSKCRQKLKSAYGVILNPVDCDLLNTWRSDFEASGFTVFQAL